MSKAFLEGYINKEGGWLSEVLGTTASTYGGAAAGGLAGGAAAGPAGAAGGLLAGAYAPILLSGVLALTKDTRDTEEQAEANLDTLKNYLPGVGTYNWWKRMGYSMRNPELKEKTRELKKNKKKKKKEDK